ncbi:MAG: glycosyltransferase family 2 protein [Planctomycetes bacterium]|nr:glycosyltransferase family 2 protein [Planctomycetota bacterium]
MKTIDLTIVIVSWNTCPLLRSCLRSVYERLGPLAAEVIVVDNASDDGSAEMVEREFPGVHLIANRDNRGFAAANNQALPIARGRYVLLLNPDTVVLDDVLKQTVRYADAHRDVAVVGCRVMRSDTEIQRTCFRFPSVLNTLLDGLGLTALCPGSSIAGRSAYGGWARDTERDVDVVSGMYMLVRREAIDAVGLLDEDFFVYGEETDWCRRFRNAGWRAVFIPAGRILHVDGGRQSTNQVSIRMFVQLQKSLLIYHRKHSGAVRATVVRLLLAASMLTRWAWWTVSAMVGGRPDADGRAARAKAALRFHLGSPGPAQDRSYRTSDDTLGKPCVSCGFSGSDLEHAHSRADEPIGP